MPPKETDALLDDNKPSYGKQFSLDEASFPNSEGSESYETTKHCGGCTLIGVMVVFTLGCLIMNSDSIVGDKLRLGIHSVAEDLAEKTQPKNKLNGSGPYSLVEAHEGKSFFDYYTFNDGPDSIGSAGYNTYVGKKKAEQLGLIKVEADEDEEEYVYISSKAGKDYDKYGNRFRDSIRLEGKRRFDDGLILLDVSKMPTGCGVWPAFWTTDEKDWPKNGEIDIVEPINNQVVAKTALHTSEDCDMYAHVPRWNWTGYWDSATGLPDTFTGELDFESALEADNCWTATPHQWANQGCVAINDQNGTIGAPMNEPLSDGTSGGIYALEWDPSGGYIKSWVFPRAHGIPANLQDALDTSGDETPVVPDPASWPTPYAFFAIGEGSGCSADHFQNHRMVINLAFCGAVAGNRFRKDCPALYEKYNVHNDSVLTCNAYINSDEAQEAIDKEAFWKIKGVYLYQRDEI